jgi:hypothetical protein
MGLRGFSENMKDDWKAPFKRRLSEGAVYADKEYLSKKRIVTYSRLEWTIHIEGANKTRYD